MKNEPGPFAFLPDIFAIFSISTRFFNNNFKGYKNMNGFKAAFCVGIIGLALSGTAQSAEPTITGFYFGGSVGASNIDLQRKPDNGLHQTDQSDTAYTVRAGYRLHTNWAAETGYVNLGKTRYDYPGEPENTIKTRLWHLTAIGILPLSDKFSAFGKVGAARVTLSEDGEKISKTSLHLGLGASYALTSSLSIRAEFDDYGKPDFGQGVTAKAHARQLSAGIDYRF